MGKKKVIQTNINKTQMIDIESKIESAILKANKKIKEEEFEINKPFINWLSIILIFLMILFIAVIAGTGWVALQLLIVSIRNGNVFTFLNIDFIGIILIAIMMIIHTYKVKKHIDDITSISDLTGISSFLISCFAFVVALLALLVD